MVQNTQQSPRTGTEFQSLPDTHTVDPLSQVDTLKVVPCPICRAMYVPTEQPPFGSTGLLETAFLGVCRFCFRCQRPSCPQCWNPVHHACACCSEEANLPFRAPVPSLEGLVFLPSTSIHTKQENTISFTCQRNGRFYTPDPTSERSSRLGAILHSAPASSGAVALDPLPTITPSQTSGISEQQYPAWLQEILGQKEAERVIAPTLGEEQQTHIANAEAMRIQPLEEQTTWPQITSSARPLATLSELPLLSLSTNKDFSPTSPVLTAEYPGEIIYQDDPGSDEISLFERIENMLIIITSILLLAVILMIVLSIVSPEINAFFLHLFHIDIRTEIAYLLQLR